MDSATRATVSGGAGCAGLLWRTVTPEPALQRNVNSKLERINSGGGRLDGDGCSMECIYIVADVRVCVCVCVHTQHKLEKYIDLQ